jgi:O-acetyl-ADP-ribose deacetylase (regulator of RNase III)
MEPLIVSGDLLDQQVEAIVNAWNRNVIPWWLLLPQGVSGAIKKRGGLQPFREISKHGPMRLGSAVLTSAGRLPFKGIIHVAGINLLWRASEYSISESVVNALRVAEENSFSSLAFPVIGAGSGGFNQEKAMAVMLHALSHATAQLSGEVRIVRFSRRRRSARSP